VIDLLAITDDPRPPESPVGAVRSGGLSVLYAPAEEQAITAAALWKREAMLEALMEGRDLLPVRYGTLVADERAAAEAVAARGAELAAGLERVRGAVELAVRVRSLETAAPAPAEAPAVSGRDYLRARVAGAEVARELHEPLAALARESVRRHGSELLRAAYLVDRDAVEPFVALVRRLQEAHADLALLCTGPWPPYSFTGEPAEA
jgi:hypothetical protein